MTPSEAARELLRNASWLEKAAPFFEILDGAGGSSRVVGGIVRDTLLGAGDPVTDLDMATVFEPEEVAKRASAAGFAVHPTGIEHGTVTLIAHGISAEVTTLRQDVETFGRHARVRFGTDWDADARRRDFTMNALYAGPDGELFDPLAGLEDCLARRVRFIGDADARIAEDRLRVYRYFRFCATHGEQRFEDGALDACARVAGDLDQLSAERIGAEMLKLLGARRCASTLERMATIGVLGADIMPDAALPALERLERAGDTDAVSRMAVLVAMGVPLDDLQKRWRLSNAVCRRIEALIFGAGLADDNRILELAYRFPEVKLQAIAVAAACAAWALEKMEALVHEAAAIAPKAFPIGGADLLEKGLTGKALGEELRRLEQDWIESGFELNRQALLDRIRLP